MSIPDLIQRLEALGVPPDDIQKFIQRELLIELAGIEAEKRRILHEVFIKKDEGSNPHPSSSKERL